MRVTKDVLRDLLPAYVAGEASADTRALVEEYAASNPTFAQELAALRVSETALPPTPPPPSTAEKLALDEARRLMAHRTWTLAAALFFTLVPLSFVVRKGELAFLLVRDAPTIAAAWWVTAAVMWVWHLRVRRRLRVTGL
jgi:anti-sigma factor RsiW